jgi:hypothetical protein
MNSHQRRKETRKLQRKIKQMYENIQGSLKENPEVYSKIFNSNSHIDIGKIFIESDLVVIKNTEGERI